MSFLSNVFTTVITVILTHLLIRFLDSGPRGKPSVNDGAVSIPNEEDKSNATEVQTPQDQELIEESALQNEATETDWNVKGEASTNDETAKEAPEKHFLKREQIWSNAKRTWVPYDSSQDIAPPPRCDLHNYFYVNVRYRGPEPSGWGTAVPTERNTHKPETILTDFSPILISFLRAYIGDEFFWDDSFKLEYKLQNFFHNLKTLRTKFETVRSISSSANATAEGRRDIARTVGATDASYGHLGDEHIVQYLNDVVEHVEVLLTFLEEEFGPVADRLALLTSYGQIEYDLLIYHFEQGLKFSTPEEGDDIAFVLTGRNYCDSGTMSYLQIKGSGYMWNGFAYEMYPVSRVIPVFLGTKEFNSLPCKLLTSNLEEKLTARGRIYTSLSGMHYKSYFGDRVIVDRRAYDSKAGYTADPDAVLPHLEDELVYLLPLRVYGFNLSRKSWVSFAVNDLAPVVFDDKAWDHLVLDPDTKTLIKGLVEVTRNVNSSKTMITDVISGKGGGLIAVLHGSPGTGKTLTAEAVAEYLERPLYMVGSSELSTDPACLEQILRGILSLATAWDAVLLIDEADVYLEQRSLHELERNALVSVALRVLEYHRGVLFLTTNRIKSFDEAFLSRFSIGIKYPELDQDARRTVWRKFFELAGIKLDDPALSRSSSDSESELVEVFEAEADSGKRPISWEDLEYLSIKPFNGRTIKNLVRTSQALALASNEPLSINHVKVVVRASEKFLGEFALARARN